MNKDWDSIVNQEEETVLDENKTNSTGDFEHNPQEPDSGVTKVEVREDRGDPSFAALEAKVKEAEDKASENWEKAIRALSELENTRKRAERDISNAHKFSVEKLAKELLPVIDSLENALASADETAGSQAAMREGVELTLKIFLGVLEKFSIKEYNPKGETFDPNLHEAMSMQPSNEVAPNTVVDVFQKGFTLHGRVIRPARVVVSKAADSST